MSGNPNHQTKNSRQIIISGPATARAVQLAIDTDRLVSRISDAAASRFADERKASLDAERLIADAQAQLQEALRHARNMLDDGRRRGASRGQKGKQTPQKGNGKATPQHQNGAKPAPRPVKAGGNGSGTPPKKDGADTKPRKAAAPKAARKPVKPADSASTVSTSAS